MARPQKKGLDYFPMDVDMINDIKITVLMGEYGCNALAVYISLLSMIYREGYHLTYTKDISYILQRNLGIEKDLITDIIKFAVEQNLFNKDEFKKHSILTSPGIQRRYQEAVRKRGSGRKIPVDNHWLLDEDETEDYILCPNFQKSSEETADFFDDSFRSGNATKKSKEEKRKEKERKRKREQRRERGKRREMRKCKHLFHTHHLSHAFS